MASLRKIALAFGLLGFWALNVEAQKPRTAQSFEIPYSIEEPWYMQDEIRMSQWSGKPLAIYNLRTPMASPDHETAARLFLKQHQEFLGLSDPNLADLQLRFSRGSRAGQTLRFSQFHQGVQVYQSETVLNFSPDGYITYVLNGYKAIPANFNTLPNISQNQAHDIATNHIGLNGRVDFDETKLFIVRKDADFRLVWQVKQVAEAPIGEWESFVDAHTGEIFKCEDISCYHGPRNAFLPEDYHQLEPEPVAEDPISECEEFLLPTGTTQVAATGTGSTFDPDPLSTAGVAYAGAYVDGNDATNASLQAEVMTRNLLDITLNAGTYSLVGPYASVLEFENPNKGTFAQASPNFTFNRNQDGFEAANTYFHIDQSMRYINLTLGISLMPFQYAGGVRFDAAGLNGADNSHYIGSNGRLAFGEGGVDDAEDADVILHELGHGLHDWATNGSLSQVNGLSEGSGDYWAQSYSRSVAVWTPAQAAYQWVFSWDGHNPFWGGRTTNYGALYPGGLVGQIHTDGQIWSTCLMKIYDAIGKTKTDMAFLEGMMLTNSTTNQQDAAIAFRQAGINMGYTISDLNQITNFFQGCGYIMPPFPVTYTNFSGNRLNPQQVRLDWETASESQNTGFEVQRKLSMDAEYEVVGFVEGQLNSDQMTSYAFTDPNASLEKSYYRLRQVDLDGMSQFSEVVEVAGAEGPAFNFVVAPNPVAERYEILLSGMPAQMSLEYRIHDLAGREMAAGTASNSDNLEIPAILELPSGVYLLQIKAGGQSAVAKFVKQ